MTLTAKWAANPYTLTVDSDNELEGTVSSSSGEVYTATEVTIEATAINDCSFKGWYNDEELVSTDNPYTFNMPGYDYHLTAHFYDAEETWNRKHGVVPVFDEENKTVTYGLYPQSRVTDEDLLASLNTLTDSDIQANGWYLYNNEYYAKLAGNPDYGTRTFDDGTTIVKDEIYWFNCEAITWKILKNNDGEYFLLSSMLLDTHRYHSDDGAVVDGTTLFACNYEYSEIRAWLNDTFYDNAFYLNSTYVKTTHVDNSKETMHPQVMNNSFTCNDTDDNVFLLSYADYKNADYGFENYTDRVARVSEYARANHAEYTNTYAEYLGNYWTRSATGEYSNQCIAVYGQDNGGFYEYFCRESDFTVRPAITLDIN